MCMHTSGHRCKKFFFSCKEISLILSLINSSLLKQFCSRFFSLLSKGFSFIEKDLSEKEKILHELHVADPTHYDTVNSMVSWECRSGAPSEKVITLIIHKLKSKENLARQKFTFCSCFIFVSRKI